ncbi:hypothetical protein [Bradyrhizobium sp. BR 1433]|uniref:hypothetical protein n=1 Tax=Bradyrhizobium sp. BR 1433 TaxID=3447967 RepID=UPI003EE70110
MTLQTLARPTFLGPSPNFNPINGLGSFNAGLLNQAVICIGQIETSDQGSHTIDTTGSSSIGWRSDGITFVNPSTSVSVGLAAVDTSNGQPGRAVNSAGVATLDVAAVFAGNGGGITDSAWQTSVPTTGSKTIAHGDLVAFVIQMTARGGSDIVRIDLPGPATVGIMSPTVTTYNGSSYTGQAASIPNVLITFADGATGWIQGGDVASTMGSKFWNSGSATKEYGQLYQMPVPMKIFGIYGWGAFSNDVTLNLYSDPLGTPAVQKSASIVAKTLSSNSGFFYKMFSSPYSTTANQPIGAVFTPGAGSISAYFKTLGNAAHRASDPWGTSGYGISRASGAFANANSSLDHYYIGLLASAFDDGTSGGGGGFVGVIGS